MSNTFEITKRSRRPNNSVLTMPSAGVLATGTIQFDRGVAFSEDPGIPDQGRLADGSSPILGFVTRQVKVGGPDLGDTIYPGRIDLPTVSGQEASFEFAEEVEVEGTTWICQTGARALTGSTPTETKLSFDLGRFCVATSGQLAQFVLVAQLAPVDSVNNTFRIRARALSGDYA